MAKQKSLIEAHEKTNDSAIQIVTDVQVHEQDGVQVRDKEDVQVHEEDVVRVHEEEGVQRVSMNKKSTGHRCNACDKGFNAPSDLDRHHEG